MWRRVAWIILICFVANADNVEAPTTVDMPSDGSTTRAGNITQKEPKFARVNSFESAIGNIAFNNQCNTSGGCFDGIKSTGQRIPKIVSAQPRLKRPVGG